MSLDTNYLVAIIAFYGAIIAFFIPLTIDMSSKLKKQYSNEFISKKFEKEKVIKRISRILLINTFSATSILLFHNNFQGRYEFISNTLILLIFFYSIHIFFDLYKYIKILKKYTDEDKVLNILQEEIENATR